MGCTISELPPSLQNAITLAEEVQKWIVDVGNNCPMPPIPLLAKTQTLSDAALKAYAKVVPLNEAGLPEDSIFSAFQEAIIKNAKEVKTQITELVFKGVVDPLAYYENSGCCLGRR